MVSALLEQAHDQEHISPLAAVLRAAFQNKMSLMTCVVLASDPPRASGRTTTIQQRCLHPHSGLASSYKDHHLLNTAILQTVMVLLTSAKR